MKQVNIEYSESIKSRNGPCTKDCSKSNIIQCNNQRLKLETGEKLLWPHVTMDGWTPCNVGASKIKVVELQGFLDLYIYMLIVL